MAPSGMSKLRERHKDRRRRAIVDAAAGLLRERGLDGLSIPEIAARADVSPATVYNLVGGQAAVAAAVLEQTVDTIQAPPTPRPRRSPILECIALMERTWAVFAEREAEVRPVLLLYQARRGTSEWAAERPLWFLTEQAVTAHAQLIAAAQEAGHFDPHLGATLVATTLFAAFKARMDLWAVGMMDLKASANASRHDTAIVLLSGALGPARTALRRMVVSR
jgi:AcrR family transcriptional regulator